MGLAIGLESARKIGEGETAECPERPYPSARFGASAIAFSAACLARSAICGYATLLA